ncbi:outer membrane beta-barrel family protein [Hymenobacter defluvii]|uniref:TonB-dependent receptor n=1 Tax=Hymenobacter defluvii TaxID=2054411 RepID=A0ABS3T8B7_9BACT|nr:outer membrane beta-barrel family protein [Hymenobacter defluvii]MBO3269884.1 TonB-dependent receptor [Hymenobacter defluvii]
MKHYITYLLLASALGYGHTVQAQSAPTSTAQSTSTRLTGTVLDEANKQPVPFATVALLPPTGDKPVAGAACDEKGSFVLTAPAGTYRLVVSFVGYTSRTETVTLGATAKDMGQLTLAATSQKLGEVTVVGEKPLVEARPDRIVYNAEADATNTGGTASDVLRKTPLLNVDADGNVQLRGSSNLRVLINNKPSAILAGNLAEALKQIPADQIKAVEVLTTPSAKYDAEGTGGVVNIVLKKNSLQGVNGRVGVAVGNRNQNLNGALNARRGKVGFTSSLSGFYNQYPGRSNSSRTDYLDGAIGQLTQNTENKSRGGGGFGKVGLTFDPTEQSGFTLDFTGNAYHSVNDQDLFNEYRVLPQLEQYNSLDTLYTRDIRQRTPSRNYDVSAGYTRTFKDQPRREWSVLGQHSVSRSRQNYTLDQFRAPELVENGNPLEYQERSENLALNRETTIQTDYVHPFKGKTTLETGAKAILRQVNSDYDLDTLRTGQQTDFARNDLRSNAFDYRQNVLAAYGSLGFSLGKKYSFTLGTRAEYTDIKGEFVGENGRFRNDYLNVLPTLSATRNLKKDGQTLGLTYARRIQRPQIYFLNPYVNQTDPRNISYGNPELRPELTQNLDVSYNTYSEKSSLTLSLYGRRTNNSIESVLTYNDTLARSESTFQNIANSSTIGSNLYASVRPVKGLQIGGNVDLNYVHLKSVALNRTSSRFLYNVSANSSYKFKEKYTAQFYAGYYAGWVQLQSRNSGYYYYSLGLKRTFLNDKADLTLNANTFLQSGINFRNTTTTPSFVSRSNFFSYQRSVRLSFSYRFGKVDNSAPQRRRRSIQNNDSKSGSSGQQGG